MSRTTIVMSDSHQDEAKEFGINVSEVCRDAVAEDVMARKAAQHYGDDFETIYAEVERDDEREKVQFIGKLVYRDFDNATDYYLTSGQQVAYVDEEGILRWAEDADLLGLEHGIAHQRLRKALGQVVYPTVLDI